VIWKIWLFAGTVATTVVVPSAPKTTFALCAIKTKPTFALSVPTVVPVVSLIVPALIGPEKVVVAIFISCRG
jgi:hypothetical protein